MTKYVLDLPEGVKFIVGKGYMMLSEKELLRIPVENLQEYKAPTVAKNATVEKPVIELPAQVIHVLKHMKTVSADSVDFAMALDNYKGKTELFGVEQSVHKISDMYVSWYLGHVEFVAKKEPKYKVFITNYSVNGYQFISMDVNESEILFVNEAVAISYSKSEANKIINFFGGKNGSLQPRKVKVDD